MIEAPIRLYVTENTDGTATLSSPSLVSAPCIGEGGEVLGDLSIHLDDRFLTIATQAVA